MHLCGAFADELDEDAAALGAEGVEGGLLDLADALAADAAHNAADLFEGFGALFSDVEGACDLKVVELALGEVDAEAAAAGDVEVEVIAAADEGAGAEGGALAALARAVEEDGELFVGGEGGGVVRGLGALATAAGGGLSGEGGEGGVW